MFLGTGICHIGHEIYVARKVCFRFLDHRGKCGPHIWPVNRVDNSNGPRFVVVEEEFLHVDGGPSFDDLLPVIVCDCFLANDKISFGSEWDGIRGASLPLKWGIQEEIFSMLIAAFIEPHVKRFGIISWNVLMDFDMNTLKREIEARLDFKDVAYNVVFGPHVLIRFEKLVEA